MLNSSDPLTPESTPIPTPTGQYLVLFAQGATETGKDILKNAGGIDVSSTSELGASEVNPDLNSSSALVYHNLGVAVMSADPNQIDSISTSSADSSNPILTIEPEMFLYAQEDAPIPFDESQVCWGLTVTKALESQFTGQGIRVAVLDTGLDLNHPDFAGRTITHQSFVDCEEVQDGHGHGTHCTGVACGARQPTKLPRYGVAYEADIYIGKVLNNAQGKGTDGSIIAGINWAVENNCEVVSMSIGGRSIVGQMYSQVYETLASRALSQGTLIIAAAGNDSWRNLISNPIVNPVARPANCPSILAVGAIDAEFKIGWFSNRGMIANGGEVNIVAPGVAVYSSWPMPTQWKILEGTSMAAPHVAGIAALMAQANPSARGQALWDLLIKNAKSLANLEAADVGAGLVQSP